MIAKIAMKEVVLGAAPADAKRREVRLADGVAVVAP
jgi:hypothetical protein